MSAYTLRTKTGKLHKPTRRERDDMIRQNVAFTQQCLKEKAIREKRREEVKTIISLVEALFMEDINSFFSPEEYLTDEGNCFHHMRGLILSNLSNLSNSSH